MRIIPATDDDLWYVDNDNNEILKDSDQESYKRGTMGLIENGWVKVFSIATGPMTTGTLIAYVKKFDKLNRMVLITDCYSHHLKDGHRTISHHSKKFRDMMGIAEKRNVVHSGILDGRASSFPRRREGESFEDVYLRQLYGRKEAGTAMTERFSEQNLYKRIEIVNEFIKRNSLQVLYKESNKVFMQQKDKWLYKKDKASGEYKIDEDGGECHLVKTCLMDLFDESSLEWCYNRNKSLDAH